MKLVDSFDRLVVTFTFAIVAACTLLLAKIFLG
jgi:hypothetical protein